MKKQILIAAAFAALTGSPAFAESPGQGATDERGATRGASTQRSGVGEAAGAPMAQNLSRDTLRQIQQSLSDQGYETNVDGIWGERSREALIEFQRAQDLAPTGELDPPTMTALNVDMKTMAGTGSGAGHVADVTRP